MGRRLSSRNTDVCFPSIFCQPCPTPRCIVPRSRRGPHCFDSARCSGIWLNRIVGPGSSSVRGHYVLLIVIFSVSRADTASYQQQAPLQTRSRRRVVGPTPRTWYRVQHAYSPRRRYRARRGVRVSGSRRLGAGSRVRSGVRSAGVHAC